MFLNNNTVPFTSGYDPYRRDTAQDAVANLVALRNENTYLKSLLKDCYYNVSDCDNPVGTRHKIEEVLGFTWTSRCPKCGAFGPCHWDDVNCPVVIKGELCGNNLIIVPIPPEGWDDD